jgi:hypothetical protein
MSFGEAPRRLRINGRAALVFDDAALAATSPARSSSCA